LAFGEFADECLLAGQKVLPNKLKNTGYEFRYPEIEGALRHLLGREPAIAGSAR
jgi:NAD dependent epimerase/dehydratase family enzyme